MRWSRPCRTPASLLARIPRRVGGALASALILASCVTSSVNTTDASALELAPFALQETVGEAAGLGQPCPRATCGQLVPEPEIVDWPITYDEERARLTAAYLDFHMADYEPTGDVWADATMVPRMVVLHHTAGPTAESAWNTFAGVKDRRRGLKEHQKVNLSTHFIIDRDGTIYRLFDETLIGRHVIGLNHVAIGVENVGGIKGHPLTEAQVQANVALIRWLEAKYPTITHVIGHHEYRKMEGHPYFDETDPKFRTVKIDPGVAFMQKVRAGLGGVAVSGPPGDADAVAAADDR